MATLFLSKFDVAERQLHTAITLFFNEADPVSIHTLAEAAAQVLYDIRAQFGAESIARDNSSIRPEKKKEWLAVLFDSRNFFKHADRDADKVHEFNDFGTHMALFDAVNMYVTIKKLNTPESWTYLTWFALQFTDFLLDSDYKNRALEVVQSVPSLRDGDRAPYLRQLTKLRTGEIKMDGVTLASGLPK